MKWIETLKLRWVVWVWNHTPNCAEMSRLASRSLEEPLPLGMRLRMRLHYLICIWCERYRKQLQFLRRAAPKLHDPLLHDSNHQLSADARKRMLERIHEAVKR